MNSETSDTMKSMSGSTAGTASMGTPGAAGSAAMEGNVQRVAQKAHEAVDRLEHTLSSGTGRVMDWQQEYGEIAREQVRANPLAVVVGAFALGYVLAKLTR
jgi:hypothetical protein